MRRAQSVACCSHSSASTLTLPACASPGVWTPEATASTSRRARRSSLVFFAGAEPSSTTGVLTSPLSPAGFVGGAAGGCLSPAASAPLFPADGCSASCSDDLSCFVAPNLAKSPVRGTFAASCGTTSTNKANFITLPAANNKTTTTTSSCSMSNLQPGNEGSGSGLARTDSWLAAALSAGLPPTPGRSARRLLDPPASPLPLLPEAFVAGLEGWAPAPLPRLWAVAPCALAVPRLRRVRRVLQGLDRLECEAY
ncbi:hypothetical protein HYH03_008692 [Edaphochlamys debaryana]|uniref:Uncharacterized protein n=1 Tax=Edaphochlamys debaryana TaxID=47281 RepID=A0A836BZ66_9CHLO|nr:hypothetical protein HYH03_008692 [Edaphochlamys debaryana]|eukprot:KAG2493029.1 hypothetical protein HYH03_008692 [Edaphochlamys debaryana]